MIPKILHFIADREEVFEWHTAHPDYQIMTWNKNIEEGEVSSQVIMCKVLHQYGGIFIDKKMISVEPFADFLLLNEFFMSATSKDELHWNVVGSIAQHPFWQQCLDQLKTATTKVPDNWLSDCFHKTAPPNVKMYSGYFFNPVDSSTTKIYRGHGRVFATPSPHVSLFAPPDVEVSILIPHYNTKARYIDECLTSILDQQGEFRMQIVIVDDGSTTLHRSILEGKIKLYQQKMRHGYFTYCRLENNVGVAAALYRGIELCNNEYIIRMDTDDIMVSTRVQTQIDFLDSHPDCMICGTQLQPFDDSNRLWPRDTLPTIHWEKFKVEQPHWFMSHPTLAYRKSAVLECGSYSKEHKDLPEDFSLELRMLKRYGIAYNLPDILLYYRIHPDQVTQKNRNNNWHGVIDQWIREVTK